MYTTLGTPTYVTSISTKLTDHFIYIADFHIAWFDYNSINYKILF